MTDLSQGPTATALRSGLQRPAWISHKVNQIAVLVRDSSRSMAGQKARDASAATQAFIDELASPVNKDGFEVAIVDFTDTSHCVVELTKVGGMAGQVPPVRIRRGWTNITSGLEGASKLLQEAQSKQLEGISFLRPVVLCYTDGRHNTGARPHDVAEKLKHLADLVTVAFGPDADLGLMRELASTPQHCYRCDNGRELRAFLATVGTTLTQALASRASATKALTKLD